MPQETDSLFTQMSVVCKTDKNELELPMMVINHLMTCGSPGLTGLIPLLSRP